PLLVDGDTGQRPGLRAGGEDDRPAGLEGLGAVTAARHLDDLRALERAAAAEQRDLVLSEEELDALGHAVGDAAGPLGRLRIGRLPVAHRDTEVLGPLEQV